MQQNKFSITLDSEKLVEIAIEPEGTTFALNRNDLIEVVVQSDIPDSISFDVVISEVENRFTLSIWPVDGDYKILKNGKELDKILGDI